MNKNAITVENLWKGYSLSNYSKSTSLRELTHKFITPFKSKNKLSESHDGDQDIFWALSDVSFEIKKGEVVGLIGPNGAGKSTLLKILSRVVRPTRGEVKIWGRVGSLLEIGTGFHPELSGHENIYLNGAVLGMGRSEIKRKYDEIIDFAGVDKFIHMPIKHYSSGMFIRLAFSVAVNLDPDVLFLDEVFAVGDSVFQKRSHEKLTKIIGSGKTVVIVSHSASSIKSLCSRAIFLENGKIISDGKIADVYRDYNERNIEVIEGNKVSDLGHPEVIDCTPVKPLESDEENQVETKIKAKPKVKMIEVFVSQLGNKLKTLDIDKEIQVELIYEVYETLKINVAMQIFDETGTAFIASPNYLGTCINEGEYRESLYEPGVYKSICKIPPNFLNDQTYSINGVLIVNNEFYSQTYSCANFSVFDTGFMRAEFKQEWDSVPIRPIMSWGTSRLS